MNRAQRRKMDHQARKHLKLVRPATIGEGEVAPVKPRGPRAIHVREGSRGGNGSFQRPFHSIKQAAAISRAGDTIVVTGVYTQNETVTIPPGVGVRGDISVEATDALAAQRMATIDAISKVVALAPAEEPAPPPATPPAQLTQAPHGDVRQEAPPAAGPSDVLGAFLAPGLAESIAAAVRGAKK
jgi:hypothetical protein